ERGCEGGRGDRRRRIVAHCVVVRVAVKFFFSSRRRHTRCYRDWSSDVCSSDLLVGLWKREADQGLQTPEPYREFGAAVRNVRPKLAEALGRSDLWGFGASAKGNTLLNYVGAKLHGIFDDSPMKQGLFTPGTHIPVQALPEDLSTIAALALLSWNWGAELKQKA